MGGDELHRATANSRRSIDLAPTTVDIFGAWKTWTTVQRRIAGVDADYVFTTAEGGYERVSRLLSRGDRRRASPGAAAALWIPGR